MLSNHKSPLEGETGLSEETDILPPCSNFLDNQTDELASYTKASPSKGLGTLTSPMSLRFSTPTSFATQFPVAALNTKDSLSR